MKEYSYYMGTGKAEHGFRLTVVMDDSRFILGYAIGTYHKEKPRKGEKYSPLEKVAMDEANKTLQKYGIEEQVDAPAKSRLVSSFLSSFKCETSCKYGEGNYKNEREFKFIVDDYIDYHNFDRLHSSLKDKLKCRTPFEAWCERRQIQIGEQL